MRKIGEAGKMQRFANHRQISEGKKMSQNEEAGVYDYKAMKNWKTN